MMEKLENISHLERAAGLFDDLKNWVIRTWRLGLLLVKGAYLVGERKRLFGKLGEEVYYKITKGEISHVELDPLVQQLDRITKRVEIEEILVRTIRFGKRPRRKRPQS